MNWEGKVGDAFFRPDGLKDHLNVILYEPAHYPNEGFGKHVCIVKVNLTSIKKGQYYDDACIVSKGEHPFIVHDSYVLYEKMEIELFNHIITCVNNGPWRPAPPVSANLLQRMQDGAKNSDDAPRKFKKIII